jgi:hypothetical protein
VPAVPYEFCTLFDVNYLPRGLVLYSSLREHCEDFRLHLLCMDEETEHVVEQLELPHVRVVPLRELEAGDRGLLETKTDRSPVEYCWTATPAICLYTLESEPAIDSITYLDADLMFFHDPQPLFDEMAASSTMLVPHRYAPQYRRAEALNGRYNVEWLTFRRDARAIEALTWWRERCLEWCYARVEDGKMGDQKYLDDWPERFEGVHVLEHPGGGLAPWNVAQYRLGERDGHVTVDGRELVFYHYHSLRLFEPTAAARAASTLLRSPRGRSPLLWTTSYPVSRDERRLVWEPYLRSLERERSRVRALAPHLAGGIGRWSARAELAPRRLAALARTGARRRRDLAAERSAAARAAAGHRSREGKDRT